MQLTFNAYAYKADHHNMAAIEAGEEMPFIWNWDDTSGYAQIGTAVVTVTLYPASEMHAKELAALNERLKAVRAENHQRERAILDQISNLQAITFEQATA